jgi:hypothetical protein
VTSITDNGTGDYTVNYTTAMPDANYSVSQGLQEGGAFFGSSAMLLSGGVLSTTAFRIVCRAGNSATNVDFPGVYLSIFR